MKKSRGWEKNFSKFINKEISSYYKEGMSEDDRKFFTGLKDCVYLLGVAINEKEYSWSSGFRKFCNDMNIDFDAPSDQNKFTMLLEKIS